MIVFNLKDITVLKCQEFSFEKNGKEILYNQIDILTNDGDIFKLSADTNSLISLRNVRNQIGTLELSLSAGFKDKPKIKIISWQAKK